MLRKIENCPLVLTLRNGNTMLTNHDVIVKGVSCLELTVESIAQISAEMFVNGIDIISVTIDESRMNDVEMEVL